MWQHHTVSADLSAPHPWVNLPFQLQSQKVLCLTEICWLWRIFEYSELIVQETSYRWFDLRAMVRYSARSSIIRWTVLVFRGWKLKAAWPLTESRMDAFLLAPNSNPTSWMSQKNWRLTRPDNIFPSSSLQFWSTCENCSLSFMFLADRSTTWCGLLLL